MRHSRLLTVYILGTIFSEGRSTATWVEWLLLQLWVNSRRTLCFSPRGFSGAASKSLRPSSRSSSALTFWFCDWLVLWHTCTAVKIWASVSRVERAERGGWEWGRCDRSATASTCEQRKTCKDIYCARNRFLFTQTKLFLASVNFCSKCNVTCKI